MGNIDSAVEDFAPYFSAFTSAKGTSLAMLERAYELRYEVYCLDCGFLPSEDYPEGRERDKYDEESVHFFVDNLRKELVGYVRLIAADAMGNFPWQEHCTSLFQGIALPKPENSLEISRLMVRRDYRRRRGDLLSGVTATSDEEGARAGERRAESPQILLSLYRQMYQYSVAAGIRYWYAAMERPLARVLDRMGFGFKQLGVEADYFGPVAPYAADLRRLEASLAENNPALLAWFQKPHGHEN